MSNNLENEGHLNLLNVDSFSHNMKLKSISKPKAYKLHVLVSGPHLSKGFPKDKEAEIQDLIRQEISIGIERQSLEGNPDFDVSLKGLGLNNTLEEQLTRTIRRKLQGPLTGRYPSDNKVDENEDTLGYLGQPIHSFNHGTCICAGNLTVPEIPVINPLSVAGPLPHTYAIYLSEDILRMVVEEAPALSGCQMLVGLASQVSWQKEITGWHLCNGQIISVTTSGPNNGPNYMLLEKSSCQSGVHTILFKKAKLLGVLTGMFALDMNTFWPYLGGKKVTFTWLMDTPYTPLPYVSSLKADGTLIREENTSPVFVVYGGAKFHVPDPNTFLSMGYDWANVQVVPANTVNKIKDLPRDGTLLRELSGAIYVIYGGAKFHIPNMNEFNALGYDAADVKQLWNGALVGIPDIPRNNTLLKERSTDAVFVILGNQKFHIPSPQRFYELCYYWENLRVVPDGAMAIIPSGGTL